jgi:hypothetical protein
VLAEHLDVRGRELGMEVEKIHVGLEPVAPMLDNAPFITRLVRCAIIELGSSVVPNASEMEVDHIDVDTIDETRCIVEGIVNHIEGVIDLVCLGGEKVEVGEAKQDVIAGSLDLLAVRHDVGLEDLHGITSTITVSGYSWEGAKTPAQFRVCSNI